MTNKQYTGALFDLDGVLIDTEGIYTIFWEDVDKQFPTGIPDFARIIKGNTLNNILNQYFPKELHATIIDILKKKESGMQYCLFDGVIDLLKRLEAAGLRKAIVTSSNPVKMSILFEQQPELRQLIDVVITDADVTRSKPDPQGYLLAAERLGCRPEDCLVFEDSYAGLEAGRRAGATVVGIASTNPYDEVARRCDIPLHSCADFQL